MLVKRNYFYIKFIFLILIFLPFFSSVLLSQEVFFKGEVSHLIKVLNEKSFNFINYPVDIVIFDFEKNYSDSSFVLSLNRMSFFNNYLFYKFFNFNLIDRWDFFPLKREGKIIGYITILNNAPSEEKWEIIMESLVYIGYID